MGDRMSLTLSQGMMGMSENVFINVKNRSLTITADVEIPAGGADGVILAQGGRFGGWSLYMKGGRPIYVYNFIGLQRSSWRRRSSWRASQGPPRFAHMGRPGQGGWRRST
jgi:arylsulfatase